MFSQKDIRRATVRIVVLCVCLLCCELSDVHGQTIQEGKASFYAKRATGSRTANGERLHHDSLTCAHRSYPFGTILKVTNVLNGKQVVVRVNDRGPFRKGRIIDLSWGAANEIGMIAQGIAPVTVERIATANIPFKPDDDVDLRLMEFEVADIDIGGMVPVWQQKPHIDQQKVKRSMRHVVAKSTRDMENPKTTKPEATSEAPATNHNIPKDVFDEINSKPNSSKAYLKREGQH